MSRSARLVVVTAIAGLFVWVFADALFGSGVFVFRDSGHFYYPLFQFVKSEWLAGRVPLWNPYENLGVPLAAGGSSSVFYPGKLIFFLPLDYATAYVWYVMAHVLLAAWAAYRLARTWGASVEGAGVAALSYAFSGNVLYQYCNVIFLVGAAWLPLAMLAAQRMLERERGIGNGEQGIGQREQGTGDREQDQARRLRPAGQGSQFHWAVALGFVLAMMVLGGSAETAYYAALMAVAYAGWLWWSESPLSLWERVRVRAGRAGLHSVESRIATEPPSSPDACAGRPPAASGRAKRSRLAASRPVLLALAGAVGVALCAVQVLPSAEFTARSHRAASSAPRTIYELPGFLMKTTTTAGDKSADRSPDARWTDGLTCRRLEPGSHQQHIYDFSVGPWRLAEYVWPNFSGRQFPIHRRWLDVVPAEGRIWVPSLYMGLVPLVLAVASMRFRRGDGLRTWLTWTVIVAVVASFGGYGLGWLAQEVRLAAGADMSKPWVVGGPFGGLYWLATVVLPGYVYFRYPAKVLVIAALGLSMLAALGWDRAMAGRSVGLRRGLVGLAAVSLLGAGAALAVRPFWAGWLSGVAPDVMFGPLDAAGAIGDLVDGFVQTAVVSLAFWWLLRRASTGARWPAQAAMLLVAVDLAVANGWMVVCAPAEQWRERPAVAAAIERVESQESRGESKSRSGDRLSTVEPEVSPGSRRAQPAGLTPQPSTFIPQPSTVNARPPSPIPHPSSLFPPFRVYREPLWTPPSWRREGAAARMAEAARWDRDTLWPKYNLADRIALSEVYGTMSLYDYEVFAARRGRLPRPAKTVPDTFSCTFSCNVKYYILRGDQRLPGEERIELDDAVEDVSLWACRQWQPRAWIVHRVEVLDGGEADGPGEIRRRTDRVFVDTDGRRRDLFRSAVVETDGRSDVLRPNNSAVALPLEAAESCRVTHYDPLCVQVEATLSQPGLVVLCDQFYPGWRVEVETVGSGVQGPHECRHYERPILRTNRVMRGVWLTAGEHHLTYRYRPASVLVGGAITALAWLGLMGFLVVCRLRARRPQNGHSLTASRA